jgi:DNA-binding NtrC family response regulator
MQHVAHGPALILVALYASSRATWLGLAQQLRTNSPGSRIIILAQESSEEMAICALRAGVTEYLTPPFTAASLVTAASTVSSRQPCDDREQPSDTRAAIVGDSAVMTCLQARLRRLSLSDCNVLLTGESGTGKELAAAAIHRFSARRDHRLVCLNCAALPDSLVESELFGHEKGAFTGADCARQGKLSAADGGTVFLDEIGDLSLYAQAKILRAVETKEIYHLGGQKPVRINVRIVAATHRHLEEMVERGQFREDLFFRLNIGRVHMPPLRDRIEDLGLLVAHYLRSMNQQMGIAVEGLSEEAWHILAGYHWPGNIRELRNVIESALVNASSPTLGADDLPPHLRGAAESSTFAAERHRLVQALLATRWNKTQAAQRLHWSRMTLYRKMAKYSLASSLSTHLD